ncbi:MAG: exosome complex RNA-binding protein Csl4 [Candidatus Thorarchaeota archaeon]
MADVKSGDTVVPGDQLCVIEELSPRFGTYEKDGVVFAATAGSVSMDFKDRSISVLSPDGKIKLPLPVQGDILVGEILSGYEKRSIVHILKVNGENAFSGLEGTILISDVTRRYVNSMHDVVRPGDIIRGVALNTHETPVKIGLVGSDFGVISAKCIKCGNPLTLTTHNNMICLHCDNRETREVAKDYGIQFGLEARPDLAPRRSSYDDRRGGDRRYDDRRGGRRDDRRRDSRRR